MSYLYAIYTYIDFFCSFVPHKPWLLLPVYVKILCDNTQDRLLIFCACCVSHALFSVKIFWFNWMKSYPQILCFWQSCLLISEHCVYIRLLVVVLFGRWVVSNSLTPWTAVHQAPLSSTVSQSLLRFMSVELVMLSNHLILCFSLLLP